MQVDILLTIHLSNGGKYLASQVNGVNYFMLSGFTKPHFLVEIQGQALLVVEDKAWRVQSYQDLAIAAFQDWRSATERNPTIPYAPIWQTSFEVLGVVRRKQVSST